MCDTEQNVDGRRDQVAEALLSELVSRMGYALQIETTVEQDRILLDLLGDGASDLIGRKGQILDALQFVLNRMLNRQDRDDRRPAVVDCGGYRERRVEALQELAGRLGDEVARTGKTVVVNPMSAHDRRVIHMALRETTGVTTCSEGEGPERHLLIVPDR